MDDSGGQMPHAVLNVLQTCSFIVRLQTGRGKDAKDIRTLVFQNYDKKKPSKSCDHSSEWFSRLDSGLCNNLNDVCSMKDRYGVDKDEFGSTFSQRIMDNIPRIEVTPTGSRKPALRNQTHGRYDYRPFICAKCDYGSTFGVLWSSLRATFNLSRNHLSRVKTSLKIDSKRCLFPVVLTGTDSEDFLVPIDLLVDVLNMFDDVQFLGFGKQLGLYVPQMINKIYMHISHNVESLGINGMGLARVAAFMEKVVWVLHLQSVTYNRFAFDIDDNKRELMHISCRLAPLQSQVVDNSRRLDHLTRVSLSLARKLNQRILSDLPGAFDVPVIDEAPLEDNWFEETLDLVTLMSGENDPSPSKLAYWYARVVKAVKGGDGDLWINMLDKAVERTGKARPTMKEIIKASKTTRLPSRVFEAPKPPVSPPEPSKKRKRGRPRGSNKGKRTRVIPPWHQDSDDSDDSDDSEDGNGAYHPSGGNREYRQRQVQKKLKNLKASQMQQ